VDLNEYQRRCQDTAIYPDLGRNLVYPALGIADEAGEIAGKVKKFIRDTGYRTGAGARSQLSDDQVHAVALEIGDVMWYCAAMANELGINLDVIAQWNLGKLADRKARDTLQGNGDYR
jgi:NTP pyrophosphatase (non-canonical NTP hydrolase)